MLDGVGGEAGDWLVKVATHTGQNFWAKAAVVYEKLVYSPRGIYIMRYCFYSELEAEPPWRQRQARRATSGFRELGQCGT